MQMEAETADHTLRAPTVEDVGTPQLGPIRSWILRHDDSVIFLILYIGLAVVLSLVSLFWLMAVVALHFALEVIKHTHTMEGSGAIIGHSLWELKLDIALVLFALGLSLYMEVLFGLLGLGGIAARAGGSAARAGSRFVAWPRMIRALLLTVDDVLLIMRGLFSKQARSARRATKDARRAKAARTGPSTDPTPAPMRPALPQSTMPVWQSRWGAGDWAAVVFGTSCLLLILGAPYLTDHTFHTAIETLIEEMRPWP